MDDLAALFSPFTIKAIELKNRIVMPALASFLIGDDGSISDATVEHYRLRAAGGPAMVITEACAVSPEGVVSSHQARIYEDRFMAGLAQIAAAIKAEGSVPAVQIHHGGRQTSIKVIKRKPLAPSALPCPTIRGEVEPLSLDGIQQLIQKFGDAAERAYQAGFELIEIHGAHGYLINQFLSGFSNIREDAYGGTVTARTRFAREIVAELRRRLGPEFPISFKISAEEYVNGGLTTPESIEILKILVEAGIDIVQVSAGNDVTAEWICQPMFMKKACLVDSAAQIKQALDIPMMAVGRINDPLIANDIIVRKKADLVCMGRGLLADPEMPLKAREGRLDEIRTCIACNTCMESIFKRGRIECLVNPMLGREKEMAFVKTRNPKKIMVIGGGPGGLNAAWVAAKRGHEVHVHEKRNELGGQLVPGSLPGHKAELRSLIRFQKKQAEIFGVRCHLNHEVTAEDVQAENPDIVILATGSLPALPSVEGIGKDIVLTYEDVLDGGRRDFNAVVIVGGGPTGLELALHLSDHGRAVTVIEMLPKAGAGLEAMTKKIILDRLKQNKVAVITNTRLLRVEDDGVVVAGPDEAESSITADKVVIAVGTRPNSSLYDQIRALGYETYQIGDCLEPRGAKDAIYDSAVLGRKI
ncbi:MAG: FAD-dependent oxidoreductase [Deltaproteobacteria bacterium]|jgi:2,4-dienoyl-CoA reductase-like NADH-dependent reductase (Old Yellow Enzyme family)/thioredoxin reductase|nr:FAD-dependent oxidoreductase [Deltaproteobacteria bacterium]